MNNMKKDYWLLVASIASWLAIILLLPKMPSTIPMHWNINGDVDGWGNKNNLIWLAGMGSFLWLLMTFIPQIDPGRANYSKFTKSYRLIRALIVIFMMAISWLTVISVLKGSLDIVFFIKIFMGIMFVGLGNVLAKIRPNWFTGIKTPWTLADPEIWKKTHRTGGYLMFAAGIVFILSAVFFKGNEGFWIPVSFLLAGVIFDVVYSAWLWKKFHGREKVPPINPPGSTKEDE